MLERVEDLDEDEFKEYEALLARVSSPDEITRSYKPSGVNDDYMLGPFVVKGQRTMLGGAKGQGKTSMAMQMIRAIVYGEDFLGYVGENGDTKILILDAEQGQKTVRRVLREAGISDLPRRVMEYWPIPGGLALDKMKQHRLAVEEQLRHGNYDVVVMDPFYKLIEGDPNSAESALRQVKLLDQWMERYGFALILPTHTRKQSAGSYGISADSFFGSSVYVRGASVLLGLERAKWGYARLRVLADRDGDLAEKYRDEPIALEFNKEDGFSQIEAIPDGRKDRSADSMRRVEEALYRNPGATIDDLIRLTRLSKTTVLRALKELEPTEQRDGRKKVYMLDRKGE